MFVKKYWVSIQEPVNIDGKNIEIKCYDGSNISLADAKDKAYQKLPILLDKIKGKLNSSEDYVVEIREEVTHEINSSNVVTRNRYGALVLNSENIPIIDIDQPKLGFFGLFNFYRGLENRKKKIYSQVKALASRAEFSKMGFRIYETKRGARVILEGVSIKPESNEMARLFRLLNSDPIYAKLCLLQKCYRARLTPKPSNIRVRVKKFLYPRSESEQNKVENWLKTYEKKSENFASCRLVETIRSQSQNLTIQYHDEITKAKSQLPLA